MSRRTWADCDQKKLQRNAALARSKSKKFCSAQKVRVNAYWDRIHNDPKLMESLRQKKCVYWTKKKRAERSKKYAGSGNPLFGVKRPDFAKNRFQPPKGWHSGDLNPAKRPEVRAKMRKPHKMSEEGRCVLARLGRKKFFRLWKEKRPVMMQGVVKNLRKRHCRYPCVTKAGQTVLMMSTWEVRFAKVLDELHVEWQYNEVHQRGPIHGVLEIYYIYKGRQHRYFPDFLTEKRSAFPYSLVEVKGRPLTEKDNAKLDAARRVGFKVLVVNIDVLRLYEANLQ